MKMWFRTKKEQQRIIDELRVENKSLVDALLQLQTKRDVQYVAQLEREHKILTDKLTQMQLDMKPTEHQKIYQEQMNIERKRFLRFLEEMQRKVDLYKSAADNYKSMADKYHVALSKQDNNYKKIVSMYCKETNTSPDDPDFMLLLSNDFLGVSCDIGNTPNDSD